MVRGQHGVIIPFHGIPVHAVRDGRPVKCGIRMDRPQPFHGRGNDAPVLIAESAVFPGVGVQGCQGDTRAHDSFADAEVFQQGSDADQFLCFQQGRHALEGSMNGCQPHRQPFPGQAHGVIVRFQAFCKEFRLPRPAETCLMQGFLADGGGDNSVNRSFPQGMGRLFQMVEGVFGGFRIRPSRGKLHSLADEAVFRIFREFSGGKRGGDDFRAYARLVAQRVSNDRFHSAATGGITIPRVPAFRQGKREFLPRGKQEFFLPEQPAGLPPVFPC